MESQTSGGGGVRAYLLEREGDGDFDLGDIDSMAAGMSRLSGCK